MIIALAGRRVDALDATQPKFPLQNIENVGSAVRALLQEHSATAVVCSAACGADLTGLAEAGKLGLRRRVVLPSARDKFRETSVIDRPGDWGSMYDSILDAVEAQGDLVVMANPDADDPYSATNRAILEEAVALGKASSEAVGALLVWDGVSRGADDYTDQFGAEARKRGLGVFEVLTT
jgi:hypothetical protein